MNRSVLAVLLVACGQPAGKVGPDAAVGGGSDAAMPDGQTANHSGGWRTTGRDASRAYRSDAAGPGATATARLFAQNASGVEFASLGTPVVDEANNVYFVSITPMQPTELVSIDGAGHERWRVQTPAGWQLGSLVLGPDGNVYTVATMGSPDTIGKILSWSSANGSARPETSPIPGLYAIVFAADGRFVEQTYTQAAGYGTQLRAATGGQTWIWPRGGDATALSPAGDAIAIMTVPSGNPQPPLELVVLHPGDGSEAWHYTFAADLQSPAVAIDADGTVFAAVSQNGSHLHVLKFSPSGQLAWDRDIASLTWASRILVGAQAIVIAAQNGQSFAGIGLQKSDGMPPANSQLTCGEPQAIDKNDVVYWSCDNGQQATTPDGAFVASWSGNTTFQIVLAPDGSAYDVPAAYFASHQLFRIN